MTRGMLVALGLLIGGTASAQQPSSGCAAPEYRQFDFWIGDWAVSDSTGRVPYGANLVTREEDGCLVHEHWRGTRGGTGQSFNFFDRRSGHWTQVWIASRGNVLQLSGHLVGSSMVLEGEGVAPTGQAIRNRIAWTPEPDGRVRQVWSTSLDGGATWTVGFDGWYRRQAAP